MTAYGPFKCEDCNKEYLTGEALQQHNHQKHGQPLPRDKDDEDQREIP